MSARNELAVRARAVGLDHTTYPNDSKLEQKLLWLEKRATTFAGAAATGVLTSDNTNNADAETVTIGSQVYTFKTALSGVKATGVLTSDATAFADGETVTIEGIQYTFRTALSSPTRPNEVLIGVSAAVSLDNIKIAINNSGGTPGTEYSIGTVAHPLVTATTNTNTAQTVQSKTYGTGSNNYLTAETCAHASWGGASLSGGVDRIANQVLIGADADGSLTNLKNAINGTGTPDTDYDGKTPVNPTVTSGAVTAHAITLTAVDFSVTNASVATTETGAHLSFGAGTLASGTPKIIAVDGSAVNGSAGLSGDANV